MATGSLNEDGLRYATSVIIPVVEERDELEYAMRVNSQRRTAIISE